jgi:hypothetical protein
MEDTTGYLKPIWDEITRQLTVKPHSFRVFKFE